MTLVAGERTLVDEVHSGRGYQSHHGTRLHFGLGRHDRVDRVEVRFDPFQTIDQEGIGQLIEFSVERGRKTRPDLKIGICGEQGGDPASVDFCFKNNLNYVSCSPYRVPIARLAAAQSAIKAKK